MHISDLAAWCKIDFANAASTPLNFAENLYLDKELVTELVIPNGVTKIKNYAFLGCKNLKSVTVPNSVTSIASTAFTGTGLEKVEFNCSTVGNWFSGNTSIKEVVIGNKVTSIGEGAFHNCSGLTAVHISDLAAWCNIDFANAASTPLNFAENLYLNKELVTELVIPDGVTKIKSYAFLGCKNLKSVTVPNSVTSIASTAFTGSGLERVELNSNAVGNWFSGNTSIKEVVIGNKVTSIGEGAFHNCSGLTAVHISDLAAWCNIDFSNAYSNPLNYANNLYLNGKLVTSLVIPNGIAEIKNNAFRNCSELTNITIPNSVTSIASTAFTGCNGLEKVEFNCSTIGNWFSGNTSIKEVVIGNKVTSAFHNCSGLTAVHISDLAAWCNIDFANAASTPLNFAENLYLDKELVTELVIPNGVTKIKNYAFLGCKNLKSVTVPNSVTSIASTAFTGTGLERVEFNCSTVGNWFSGNTSIKEVVIGNKVTSIEGSAFSGCSGLESVVIGNGIASLESNLFSGCTGLESITIGNGVTSIAELCFAGCDIKKCFWLTNTPPTGYKNVGAKVNYVANNKYSELGNVKQYSYLSSYFENEGIRYIPVSLADRTCDIVDCISGNGIEDFTVNETVSYRGIEMTVNEIMPYSFYDNNNYGNVTLNNHGGIGEYAFANCTDMNSVTLCESITSIGAYAFDNCKKITEFKVPAAVANIGDCAFKGCEGLAEFIVKDREAELTLGSNGSLPLFNDCPLDSVYIGGNITYNTSEVKGYSPFYNNKTLRTVVIANSEKDVPDNEFYGCSGLENVCIGDGVESIGNWAFSGCNSLGYFAFGKNLQSIGEEAFSDCYNVIKIVSRAKTPPACGAQALDDINKWNCVLSVPETEIEKYRAAEQWREFLYIEGIPATEYAVTFMLDGEVYATVYVEYGEKITLPATPEKEGYTFSGWSEIPATMPANDITVTGEFIMNDGIDEVEAESEEEMKKRREIYDLNGRKLENANKGVYIINGKKVFIK